MIFLENQTKVPLDPIPLEAIADTLSGRDIELILCRDAAIAKLNQKHRNRDQPTDVLSFPIQSDHAHMPLGTVIISSDRAQAKADELGHTFADEISLLFVHGALHLLGYDHETDTGQMREREHAILRQFGLPESLIVRTEAS